MAIKLYPPRLEGILPAFYKNYDKNNFKRPLIGASFTIPFGRNPAVNRTEVATVTLRLRTVSTNTYIVADLEASSVDLDMCTATFILPYDEKSTDPNVKIADTINEGQYYRAQLAFKSNDGIIGYYSTVGIIKCVAEPEVTIEGFEPGIVNGVMMTEFIGLYQQDTRFGDTTEKVYSYHFSLWDEDGNQIISDEEILHDATQDIQSDASRDYCDVFIDLRVGAIYTLQYTVTTLNGLVKSSPRYKIMKTISVEPEFPLRLHGAVNLEEGYIELTLKGEKVSLQNYDGHYERVPTDSTFDTNKDYYILAGNGVYVRFEGGRRDWNDRRDSTSDDPTTYVYSIVGDTTTEVEATSNSVFLITRSSSKDGFATWQEVVRFVLDTGYPSDYSFRDFTIEQGESYRYAIQQYNIHGIYSNRIYMSYDDDRLDEDNHVQQKIIVADFEDMFLYDGERQLKVRFNPHIKSFKSVRSEQKIETIGSKFPYIFRNGVVNYKEFPIEGLITYQEDEALLFLSEEEAEQAGILEPVYDPRIGAKNPKQTKLSRDDQQGGQRRMVRTNKDLTSENIMGERYFKLKVLDWLNDGKVKLFRSPTEGAYLVRLMSVSYTPEDVLGRMIHNFSCMGYEIAELTYDNLVAYGIIHPKDPSLYESHWGAADVNRAINGESPDGFYEIPLESNSVQRVEFSDFAPGDIVKIKYGTSDPELELTIGVTGSLNLIADERVITNIWIKPNPDVDNYNDFSRSLIYTFTGTQLSAFDAIKDVRMHEVVAEQFVGPQENLLEPYILRDRVYGIKDAVTGITPVRISMEEGYNDLYADLEAHKRFSYILKREGETDTDKFKGYKIDILQVHKRDVIPVFSRDAVITDDTIFDVTPFGQPYVPTDYAEEGEEAIHNTYDISNFIKNNRINYANGNIVDTDPYHYYGGVNINDIYPLLEKNNPNIDHFTILKAYVRNNNEEWVEPDSHKYYDTYTESWWEDDEEYDPTFSLTEPNDDDLINEQLPELADFKGSSNIRMTEINDLTLRNLGEVEYLRLGNGVVAEVTIQLRVVDYDIEESEPVKSAKDKYLNAKNQYFTSLNNLAKNADELEDAFAEKVELQKLLDQNEEQLKKYSGATTAIDSVLAVIRQRMQDQKIKLYNTAIERYETIEELLKHIDAPIDENDTQSLSRALNNVSAYPEDEKDDNGRIIHPVNIYTPREVDYRDLERYEFSITPDEYIEWAYIYKPQYEAIINDNNDLIDKNNDEIRTREKLIGDKNGYFSDVLNDGIKEGTIAYYDNLIDEQNVLFDNLINKYNDELAAIDEEILEVKKILLYNDLIKNNEIEFDQYTDQYILNNVQKLKDRLDRLIEICEQDLLDLEGRYNADLEKIFNAYNNGSDEDVDPLRQMANDYFNEYTAINAHYNDADWLSENYKTMIDYFMVLVEKE